MAERPRDTAAAGDGGLWWAAAYTLGARVAVAGAALANAAQQDYTMVAAQELGRYGVTANMVYLPVTDTGCVTPAVREQAVAGSPLRHVAQPHDIQRMIDKVAGPDLAHLNQLDRTVAAAGSHPVTHAGRPRSRLPASS